MLHHLVSVELILLLKRLPCGYLWKNLLRYVFSERAKHICLRTIREYNDSEGEIFNVLEEDQARDGCSWPRIHPIWIKRGDIIDVYNTEHYNDGCMIWNGSGPECLDGVPIGCTDYCCFPSWRFTINEMGRNDFWLDRLSHTNEMSLGFAIKEYEVVERRPVPLAGSNLNRAYVGLGVCYIVQHAKRTNDQWAFASRQLSSCPVWIYTDELTIHDDALDQSVFSAGMASRYGGPKQIEAIGPSGETIMEYSIYDAIRSGFGKVVFIVREEVIEAFKLKFEPKLKGKIVSAYICQNLHSFTGDKSKSIPVERTKPWGTGHAILCCKGTVTEPFAVINADDFYGRDALEKACAFLNKECAPNNHCMIGYAIQATLSENGSVNRGVCQVDAKGDLISISERTNISRTNETTTVSMNLWGFHPSVFEHFERSFHNFMDKHVLDSTAEFFLPSVVAEFIIGSSEGVKVIHTTAQWFGLTYAKDAPLVQASIKTLVAQLVYPINLWEVNKEPNLKE